ncbi:response regulator [sulfur-oxidizing endosymbiont of Gigantopelta aegis]|uniref:response regulator n=1 Tax=sulfur-oxidizing endosymbiont of Gigantopelta aegis TaxID=2794934 RepID=UPI0018DDA0BA|nr:response regulator [sulfur-oxidizing endosymbiont of Gigantopelta aegis]
MNRSNATVLVVDDEPFNLEIIEEYLEGEGYKLFTAADGQDAWTQLESEPSKFDVILLDRMMPKLDGMEVLAKIKSHRKLKSTPVILQTAKASQQNIIEGMNSGAYYYLTKPFDDEMLRSIVRTAIEDKMRYDLLTSKLEESVRGLSTLHEAIFEFQSIDEANDLAKVLANACAYPDKVVTGISELLINAVEHGNLDICYAEKSKLMVKDLWESEVTKRLDSLEHKDKRVRVRFKRGASTNKILIVDEGKGFEWQNFLELDPLRAFDSHGRGIAMAKMTSVDEIKYLGSGNRVEITVQGNKR